MNKYYISTSSLKKIIYEQIIKYFPNSVNINQADEKEFENIKAFTESIIEKSLEDMNNNCAGCVFHNVICPTNCFDCKYLTKKGCDLDICKQCINNNFWRENESI